MKRPRVRVEVDAIAVASEAEGVVAIVMTKRQERGGDSALRVNEDAPPAHGCTRLVLHHAELRKGVDERVRVRADAKRDAFAEELRAPRYAIAQVALGGRAETDLGAGRGERAEVLIV